MCLLMYVFTSVRADAGNSNFCYALITVFIYVCIHVCMYAYMYT